MKKAGLLSAVFVLCIVGRASATPLTMDYSITDLGGSSYHYDFTLTLDNHDSSWVLGNEWDWILFGYNTAGDTLNSFDTNGSASGGLNWTTLTFSSPISSFTQSGGGYNGPTLEIAGSVLLPGWSPTAVGQSLSWSGTSGIYIPDGELHWANLVVGGGATFVADAIAHGNTVNSTAPEPASMVLLGTGLLGIAAKIRQRRKQS